MNVLPSDGFAILFDMSLIALIFYRREDFPVDFPFDFADCECKIRLCCHMTSTMSRHQIIDLVDLWLHRDGPRVHDRKGHKQ